MTVPPAGMVGAATATEQVRARGVQHLGDPASAGFRHASPSALGAELSDDSLTMSPEEKLPHKRGTAKRDARGNLPSGKRLALSLPRPTRRESPSAHKGRERSPRARGPKSLEERVLAIELQGAFNHNALKGLKDDLDNQIKMGLDLRREVFGSRATVADAMAAIEAKFLTMEGQLESEIASMDGQLAALRQNLEQAQAQLPMDGRVVQETFVNITAEIATLKGKQGETFTKGMVTELELMQRRVADHEARIQTLTGAEGQLTGRLLRATPSDRRELPRAPRSRRHARLATTTPPINWSPPRTLIRRLRRLLWEFLGEAVGGLELRRLWKGIGRF